MTSTDVRVDRIVARRIGVVFDLGGRGFDIKPADPPITLDGRSLRDALMEKFGAPVDVVVSANTHIDRISWLQGVLLVNPGSPNLHSARPKGSLGTVAVLTIDDGLVDAAIVDLERPRRRGYQTTDAHK